MTLFSRPPQAPSTSVVAPLLLEHWQLQLGPQLTRSQNTAFSAQNESGKRFAVRDTPDDGGSGGDTADERICDELYFVTTNCTLLRSFPIIVAPASALPCPCTPTRTVHWRCGDVILCVFG